MKNGDLEKKVALQLHYRYARNDKDLKIYDSKDRELLRVEENDLFDLCIINDIRILTKFHITVSITT